MLKGSRWKEICVECGHLVDEEDALYIARRGPLCHQCYGELQGSQRDDQLEDRQRRIPALKGIRWKEVCIECGHLVEEDDALYLGNKGPLCPQCHSKCLSAKRQKAKNRTAGIPLPVNFKLFGILAVVVIGGLIASLVVPRLLGIRHASELDIAGLGDFELAELRLLFDQNRDTQLGRIAQELITYGSIAAADDTRPQPLYSAKELEGLLLENSPESSEEPVENLDATDSQAPVDNRGKMRRLLQEAAEVADVSRQRTAQFAADLSRCWEAGEFNADAGAVIALLQQYSQDDGVARGKER